MAIAADQTSRLLDYLPGVFQEDLQGQPSPFLGRFLLGFEKLLLGLGDATEPGLEEIVDRLYRYFDPGADLTEEVERAPPDFLPWLAGWLALTLREDLAPDRQRYLIANACRLYQMRGTRQGVEEFVSIYTLLGVSIDEQSTAFQVGRHSTVGKDSYIGGGAPFFFRVRVFSPNPDPETLRRTTEVAQAIVDLQKPAHTFYTLKVESHAFQVGIHSTVGVDTLVTTPPSE